MSSEIIKLSLNYEKYVLLEELHKKGAQYYSQSQHGMLSLSCQFYTIGLNFPTPCYTFLEILPRTQCGRYGGKYKINYLKSGK